MTERLWAGHGWPIERIACIGEVRPAGGRPAQTRPEETINMSCGECLGPFPLAVDTNFLALRKPPGWAAYYWSIGGPVGT